MTDTDIFIGLAVAVWAVVVTGAMILAVCLTRKHLKRDH